MKCVRLTLASLHVPHDRGKYSVEADGPYISNRLVRDLYKLPVKLDVIRVNLFIWSFVGLRSVQIVHSQQDS